MSDGLTLWYSTLGVGDGHDYATRGYLDALTAAGYTNIRLPPSQQTNMLVIGAAEDGELDRFIPFVRPRGLAPLVYVAEGDPRIGTPKPVGCVGGDPSNGIPELPEADRLWKAGDLDVQNLPPEALSSNVDSTVTRIVIHHDPGSIVRMLSGLLRLGRPEGKLVGIAVWEADRLPAAVAQILSELDLVIVPSEHSARAFQVSGLDTKLVVIPHAFDVERVWTRPTPDEQPEPGPFTFYTIASPILRKNLEGLIAAYYEAFDSSFDVRLGIKANVRKQLIQEIEERAMVRSGRTSREGLPPVRWFTQRWETSRMRDFHLACHCWVSATRGEGFDLPLAEALLCGNHVITPAWGASVELTPGVCKDARYVALSGLVPVPTEMSAYGPYASNQQWAEPDLDDLALAMVAAYGMRGSRERDPGQWDRLAPKLCSKAVGDTLAETLRGL